MMSSDTSLKVTELFILFIMHMCEEFILRGGGAPPAGEGVNDSLVFVLSVLINV